jgi:hypothetical protein
LRPHFAEVAGEPGFGSDIARGVSVVVTRSSVEEMGMYRTYFHSGVSVPLTMKTENISTVHVRG